MDDLAPAPGSDVEQGQAEEPRTPQRLHALKDKDTFIVADSRGDILGAADGLFHNDTRLLSRFRLLLGREPPSLLSGAVSADNVFFTFNGANQELPLPGGPIGPPGVLHVERKRFLWRERLFERITCVNYSRDEVLTPLSIEFGADFRDMFEVRGAKRARRGVTFPAQVDGRTVAFRYEGLDAVERSSVITFSDPPLRLSATRADYLYPLRPEGRLELYLEIGATAEEPPSRERFRANAAAARWDMRSRIRHGARLKSSGRLFNQWLDKSRADLALLTTRMETGPYPYAGIPWFSTAFGRDAIITAWQILWFEPSLAKGVLTYLAAHQAEEVSAFRDSAPGKIMHETRKGEMPALGEVPFGRYYGGVDTTPLFVALAGAYAERTGDLQLIDDLWPALTAATAWMEHFGDTDGDGLIDYARGAESGLANQGWKDSQDSVFHADGRFPKGPIALVEVQGYAFAAYKAMSRFALWRKDVAGAQRWAERAEHIRVTVEARFWMEDQGGYGIAIDGAGELCRVASSNPGHLLFCGLPSPERAARVTTQLLSARFDSGWGLRTLATGEARFNPMSYHNGSIWPHDTAVCAAGLSRYGERDGVVDLMSGLFETASSFEMRLPELFCGFPRAAGEPPVAYPVACLPQAWAAGSVFMLLQACLGLRVDGWTGEVEIRDPRLPIGIDQLRVEGLRVGDQKLDLNFERLQGRIAVHADGGARVPVTIRQGGRA
ncbi:amylo-alpha-1,6-glucosidase [Phenylobacterium aquaticum]|uniref:amylo-alpha-1,6-glucosidase n=1 Tax=Phenylobacterium aquaticum TaxID=1763816 RepID=UPI0026E92197|nr:amylo-alpha-1,6-glucosidase [Phenylobacterium aquaticum]